MLGEKFFRQGNLFPSKHSERIPESGQSGSVQFGHLTEERKHGEFYLEKRRRRLLTRIVILNICFMTLEIQSVESASISH
jgi:hypothetical protein